MTDGMAAKVESDFRAVNPLMHVLTWLIGRLPLSVTYPFGRFISFVAHRVVRYRLRIVRANIRDCFPEMSCDRRRDVERDFYRRLGRYAVETPRMRYMSVEEMKRRMEVCNAGEAERLLRSGKSIVVYTAHFGNWEWETSFPLWFSDSDLQSAHVYRPLKNKWFDRYFLSLRSRFSKPIPQKSTLRQMIIWRKQGISSITGFLSDQKPGRRTACKTVDFFSRPTPFIAGTEELARKLGFAAGYFDLECLDTGYYRCTFRLITTDASSLPEGELTARYAALLERTVRRCPGAYLWSHNKWRLDKKKLKEDSEL